MKKSFCYFGALLGLAVGFLLFTPADSATAQPTVVPDLTLNAPGLGVALTHTPDRAAFQLAADGKTWQLMTPFGVPGAPWLTVRELRFDPDPLVYNNILVYNNTGISQTYTFTTTLPTTWPAPNMIRGSVDTSIIGANGVVSALPNSSIYAAQIDGITVKTLQDYPFTLTTPQDAVSQSALFGFEMSNIAVGSTIGIVLKFDLSPGDYAAIISDFEVTAIPEPGSLALLLLGGCVVAWRCRRK